VGDQVAGFEWVFEVGCVAGEEEEALYGDGAISSSVLYVDRRVESGKGHVHIRRVGGDAVFAGAEDGECAVVSVDGGAAAAGVLLLQA